MIARVVFLFAYVAAFAQLPPPQAPRPPLTRDSRSPKPRTAMGRVDATVSDLKGVPIPGLTAADFTVESDGKQQVVESCVYRAGQCIEDLKDRRRAADLYRLYLNLVDMGAPSIYPRDEAVARLRKATTQRKNRIAQTLQQAGKELVDAT